jgi:hypothetical protein
MKTVKEKLKRRPLADNMDEIAGDISSLQKVSISVKKNTKNYLKIGRKLPGIHESRPCFEQSLGGAMAAK